MSRGRVYRACACRGEDGRQLGTHCPELAASTKHGRWEYAVDLPAQEQVGLPRVKLHSLRHLAATLMIGSGVPLAVASKMLRHSQVGITSDLYGHLTREVSHAAADGLAAVLDAAAAERAAEDRMHSATTARPHSHLPDLLKTRS